MISEEQKIQRMNYIGASDCAAALGMSRWKTQLEFWAEKTGVVVPENIDDELHVILGNELEDVVARLFMKKTGKKVHRVNETLYHPEYKFIAANLDRRVVGENALLQCKTCSAWKAKEWQGEEIPQEYCLQEYHEMMVSGYKHAYIAVLIGNQEFKHKEIFWDDEIVNKILKQEVNFWNNFVLTKTMPTQITADDGSTLYKIFEISDPNKDVILPDDANVLCEQIEAMNQDYCGLEKQIEEAKNKLKALLGEAESGQTNNYRITWKKQFTKRIDTERLKKEQLTIYQAYLNETGSRVLRYKRKEVK